MLKLLKAVGITIVRATNVISSKAFNLGYECSLHVIGLAHHLVRVAKKDGPYYFVIDAIGAPFMLLNMALRKFGEEPLFGKIDVWRHQENERLLAESSGDFFTLHHPADSPANPFYVARNLANSSFLKRAALLGNSVNNLFYFGLGAGGIFIGSFILPSSLCLFLHSLNGLKLIQNISKNILLVTDGTDDTTFMQQFLIGDKKGVKKSFEDEEVSSQDLERMKSIVDYFKERMDKDGEKFASNIPYNAKELQYFRQLHDFTVSEDTRAKIDRTVKKVLQKHTTLPDACNNIILSYANSFGIHLYELCICGDEITKDKISKDKISKDEITNRAILNRASLKDYVAEENAKEMLRDIDPEIVELRNAELGLSELGSKKLK